MSYLAPLLHGSLFHLAWVAFWFLIVLTILVFVHELGHYLIARRNGVKIEIFSIGFGPELFGWYDRAGTRWKFSAMPLGGYVKMFGDADASSGLAAPSLSQLSPAEREISFHGKRLGQRAAIVAGGPIANFVFAIVVLAVLFMTYGQPFTPAEVGQVQPNSAAEQAGIKPGDKIVSINERSIERFEDVQQIVRLNPGIAMSIVVQRDGQPVTLSVTPSRVQQTDRFGDRHEIGLLGIGRSGVEYVRRDPLSAVGRAVGKTWNLSAATLEATTTPAAASAPLTLGGSVASST